MGKPEDKSLWSGVFLFFFLSGNSRQSRHLNQCFPFQRKDVLGLPETFIIRGTTVKLRVRNRNPILEKHCN